MKGYEVTVARRGGFPAWFWEVHCPPAEGVTIPGIGAVVRGAAFTRRGAWRAARRAYNDHRTLHAPADLTEKWEWPA